MVGFLTGGKPLEPEIRRRTAVARAFASFFKDSRERSPTPPDITTDKGVPHREMERWNYPLRKSGTRRDGFYFRKVWRDPKTGRFAKRFDAKEFAKKQGLRVGR